jgi:acetate kinase
MRPAVLVVNAGSATVKYALYADTLECVLHGLEEGGDHAAMLAKVLKKIQEHEVVAAGHRVVHGADRYTAPTKITPEVLEKLESFIPLAPLHQPYNLAGIRAVTAQRPRLPQVACFDTAFHQTQPEIARRFALPGALHDAGVKRYGFHGLSYEYVAGKLPSVEGYRKNWKTIVAHLGNGASLCALQGGRSIASTMGFTALEGLMMGTRSGSIDPGVLLYLMDEKGYTSQGLTQLLYRDSGLLGVSGLSHDMRTLLASREPRARLAVELFVYRIVREAGSLAAALGGLDALVFTGGIGEHAAAVRLAVCEALRWLGDFAVAVIPTNEELMIAHHTLQRLGHAVPAAA